jgi:hypothetical protein
MAIAVFDRQPEGSRSLSGCIPRVADPLTTSFKLLFVHLDLASLIFAFIAFI